MLYGARPMSESESKLDTIMAERRAKASELREAGYNPFVNGVKPAHTIADVRARYESTKPAPPPPPDPSAPKVKGPPAPITPIDGELVKVAGRVLVKRGMGKTVFAPIRDTTGELQLFCNVDHLDPKEFEHVLARLDVGDIVVAEGPAFWTKTGELSILVKRLTIATKSLRPLPSKEFVTDKGEARGGLTDIDQRYRQRYVDMIVRPEVQTVFRKRSQIVSGIRAFLDQRQFLEVETPMMQTMIGGAAARPFITHHNTQDMQLYLRIAPELYLKRLVVGGFDRVYEINRNFRNEGMDRTHNPEFTMLEFYWAYATYTDLMDLTEAMVVEVAQAVNGSLKASWDGVDIDLTPPWRRLTIREACRTLGGITDATKVFEEPGVAAQVCLERKVAPNKLIGVLLEGLPGGEGNSDHADLVQRFKDASQREAVVTTIVERIPPAQRRITAGHLGYLLFEETAEKHLVEPTFLTEFPLAVSPLARRNDTDPAFCDRFELFVNGKELANGFSELNDPDDQRSRFQAQVQAKAVGAAETMDYDEDYCRALEIGMPPTAGEGIGIDRLAMLLTGQPSIRDVILFPLMKPE
jgi:lysyl-tRNA synthetase class 2